MGTCNYSQTKKKTFTINVERRSASVKSEYKIIKLLGQGASSQVFHVVDRKGNPMAMKLLRKTELRSKFFFHTEVKILKKLQHPNIVQFVKSDEDCNSFKIFTSFCEGGQLFDRVQLGYFSEKVASKYSREILRAVDICHSQNIVHRDLKPENFVFKRNSSDSELKLIDFGCSRKIKPKDIVPDLCGSPYYIAPEILRNCPLTGDQWKAADMWSVGVIMFLLVAG